MSRIRPQGIDLPAEGSARTNGGALFYRRLLLFDSPPSLQFLSGPLLKTTWPVLLKKRPVPHLTFPRCSAFVRQNARGANDDDPPATTANLLSDRVTGIAPVSSRGARLDNKVRKRSALHILGAREMPVVDLRHRRARAGAHRRPHSFPREPTRSMKEKPPPRCRPDNTPMVRAGGLERRGCPPTYINCRKVNANMPQCFYHFHEMTRGQRNR